VKVAAAVKPEDDEAGQRKEEVDAIRPEAQGSDGLRVHVCVK
jgi:hypothetical protein